jgi:hypothetical protein
MQKRKNIEPAAASSSAAASPAHVFHEPQPITGVPPLTVAHLDEQFPRRSDCDPPPSVEVKASGELTDGEDRLFAHLYARKYHAAAAPISTVHSPAHKELTIAHLPTTEIGSADASKSTVQQRSALTEKVLHTLAVPAGGGGGDRHVAAQLQSIVKREPELYRDAVETASGVEAGQRLTVEDMMELKRLPG